MFEGPAYESYLRLCRELRLEREIHEGDWWVDDLDGEVKCGSSMSEYLRNQPVMQMLPQRPDVVWVPSLTDWLSMLEEAKAYVVELNSDDGTPGSDHECRASTEGRRGNPMYGYGFTREEAAARLWMSVTGRTVTSG